MFFGENFHPFFIFPWLDTKFLCSSVDVVYKIAVPFTYTLISRICGQVIPTC